VAFAEQVGLGGVEVFRPAPIVVGLGGVAAGDEAVDLGVAVGCVGGDGEDESVAEPVAQPSGLSTDGEAGGEKFTVGRAAAA
jgi:hypothetical protein